MIWQQILIPPLVGGVVGYFTNSLAVRMLFHPLKPVFVLGKQLPFTPGLVPAEQDRLAEKVSQLIVETLLTPEDFGRLAQNLLTPERVGRGIDKVSLILIDSFSEEERFERMTLEVSYFLSTKITQHVPELAQNLSEKSLTPERIQQLLDQIIDSIVDNFHISPDLAHMASEQLLTTVLSSNNLRFSLIGLLTPQNIKAIDDLIREKVSGKYGVLLFFMNIPETLGKLRSFLNTEPERSTELIEEVIEMMHLEDMVYRGILNFHPDKLAPEQVVLFKENLVVWIHDYLSENQQTILSSLIEKIELNELLLIFLRRLNPKSIPEDMFEKAKSSMSDFILKHVDSELLNWVDKLLIAANIQSLIAGKIRDFSPAKMEAIILDVSKKELSMIVVLGGVLGVLIGGLQSLMLIFL